MPAELAIILTATEADRLEQAEALVRGFCGWHIAPSRTETAAAFRGKGGSTLLLPSLHVTAVSSVGDAGTELLAETDYTWSTAGVITRAGHWSHEVVEVTFTHGYPTPPPEVTAVVQAVAQRAVDNPSSLVRRQVGPFADTYSTTGSNQVATLALLDSEKETLRRYRIPTVA